MSRLIYGYPGSVGVVESLMGFEKGDPGECWGLPGWTGGVGIFCDGV